MMKIDCTDVFFFFYSLACACCCRQVARYGWYINTQVTTDAVQPWCIKDIAFLQLLILNAQIKPL